MQVPSQQVRLLLAEHGEVRTQFADEWIGQISLPNEVADFYREVGPCNITIAGYGNPYFLPSLAHLWNYQAGYRWNGLTGDPIPDWHNDWLVVADEGDGAFIYDRSSGHVLLAQHGTGVWKPDDIFPDVNTMAACLAILGSVFREAGDYFVDQDHFVQPEYRKRAVLRLADILGSTSDAERLVTSARWG